MSADARVGGWGNARRRRVAGLPPTAVVPVAAIGGLAVALASPDPAPLSLIACAALVVAAAATSSLKPTPEQAPQAGFAVAPAVVEEKSAN